MKALVTIYDLRLTFYDPQQVRDLRHDAAHRRRIRPRNRLVQFCDAEALNDVLLLLRVSDRATIVLDRDASAFIFCLLCHLSIFDSRIAIFDLATAN